MKQLSLLIAFCALFCLPGFAQSTTTSEKNASKITITTQKVDESGKTITETWIAEGNEPADILKEMAVNHEGIQKVEITATGGDQEKIFQYRAAGEPGDVTVVTGEPLDGEKVVVVTRTYNGPKTSASATVRVGEKPETNCAALGVLITRNENVYGAAISGLIEKGGAQEAGLKVGDIIKKVDEFDVNDYPSLFFALSHFKVGDEATVLYDREGKTYQQKVLLKGWDQIPGQEFRARTDCGEPQAPAKPHDQPITVDPGTNSIQPLELQDARIYPNPSDGVFSFSFTTEPGPLAITVTDVAGKVVYRDLNDNTTGYYNREINIKSMPQGNYIMAVLQGEKRFTQQISKQ